MEELRAPRTLTGRSATRKTPRLVFFLSAIILCTQASPLWSADSRRLATVPALGVVAEGQTGIIHYIVLQIDEDPRQQEGPTVQFNEINLGGGSIVSEDWKEGVKRAVAAATKLVGEDGREWVSHDQEPVIQCVDRGNERQQRRRGRHRGSLARRRRQVRRRPDRDNHAERSDRTGSCTSRQSRSGGPRTV